jgi:hypothetical protein
MRIKGGTMMIVLKCSFCNSTDLRKRDNLEENQVHCNCCNRVLDIDFECDLEEMFTNIDDD